MTYTYKLARRLAILRDLAMLPALVLLAACMGETTGPESTTSVPVTPIAFRVVPSAVTIETNQPIRFRGESMTRRGQRFPAPLSWESSGGTIQRDGTFSASAPGVYKVVGRGHGRQRPDTSIVVVVPPVTNVRAVEISPRVATVSAGATHTFTAVGRLSRARTAPIGVIWSATGGSIDPSGIYTAGPVAGNYRVIAANTAGSLADTAAVRIIRAEPPATEPPGTDPPGTDPPVGPIPVPVPEPDPGPTPVPEPDPAPTPPSPTLAKVVLKPATVSLTTGATRQFVAFGRNSLGDSVAVAVSFKATGGTITRAGLYTAGATPGTFKVVATMSGLADTSVVTIARALTSGPTPVPGGTGIPMGLSALLSSGADPSPYNMSLDGYNADRIVSRLAEARAKKIHVLMNMTGGRHSNYMTDGVFDLTKWQAKMDSYNTPAIRAAVAEAVADGTIIGNSVMDEPNNTSLTNSWGPAGTMNKARVDGLCRYVKSIFPTLPVGVVHNHKVMEPEKGYQYCDFIVSQYRLSKGDVREFRDSGLAFAKRAGISIAFSLNILHGGTPGTDCEKWGDDPHGKLCPMSPEQLREFGLTLGSAGCALNMWRYEKAYHEKPEIRRVLNELAESLGRLPRKPCRRT